MVAARRSITRILHARLAHALGQHHQLHRDMRYAYYCAFDPLAPTSSQCVHRRTRRQACTGMSSAYRRVPAHPAHTLHAERPLPPDVHGEMAGEVQTRPSVAAQSRWRCRRSSVHASSSEYRGRSSVGQSFQHQALTRQHQARTLDQGFTEETKPAGTGAGTTCVPLLPRLAVRAHCTALSSDLRKGATSSPFTSYRDKDPVENLMVHYQSISTGLEHRNDSFEVSTCFFGICAPIN
jgi:hypothetical protein